MKKTNQDDGPQGRHAGAEKNHEKTDQSRQRKQCKQPGGRHALHDVGTREPSDHESNQVQLQVKRSILLEQSRILCCTSRMTKLATPMSANVEELCDNSFYQVAVTPDVA